MVTSLGLPAAPGTGQREREMSLDGMDVDQAQRLAQRLDGYARGLAQITGMLTTLTAELSQHWRGAACDRLMVVLV